MSQIPLALTARLKPVVSYFESAVFEFRHSLLREVTEYSCLLPPSFPKLLKPFPIDFTSQLANR
jgi:hypothetical protein